MQIRDLQRALLARGFDVGPRGADGDFGPATLSALKAYQRANGLQDGVWPGAETMAALSSAQPAEQKMSPLGLAALIGREGRRLTAYRDSVGIWTIGIGHTAAAGAPVPKAGMTISATECDAIFARDIVQYEQAVRRAVTVPLADHQFDALVSICFNIGTTGTANSTFVRRINARDTPAAVQNAILMWNKPKEIISRRTAEADQFATPYSVAMPKARSTDAARVKA